MIPFVINKPFQLYYRRGQSEFLVHDMGFALHRLLGRRFFDLKIVRGNDLVVDNEIVVVLVELRHNARQRLVDNEKQAVVFE